MHKFSIMTIAILAGDVLKEEWLSKEKPATVEFIWADSVGALLAIEADAWFDLEFDMDPERIEKLKRLSGSPLFVNAVTWTGKVMGHKWIRINAWPTLLRRPLTEIAITDASQEVIVQRVFEQLQWSYQLVPDTCGMVTPRVLSMMINEAYYTFGSDVSSKEEIDVAMKLGTNYPMGPFEWSHRIGVKRIDELLHELDRTDARYDIAPILLEEATRK